MNSLYDVLDVDKDSSKEVIEEAYREMAKTAHPDKGGTDEKMAELNLAHDVLTDDAKRLRYDHEGDVEQDSVDKDALSFIVQVFQSLISGVDIEHNDIVNLVKTASHKHIQESRNHVMSCEDNIKLKQNVHDRLTHAGASGSYLHIVLRSDIDEQKYQITKHEHSIAVATKAIEMMKLYSYRIDEENNIMSGTSHYTITGGGW